MLDDANLATAVPGGIGMAMLNNGQSCNASTRMLVPKASYQKVADIAAATAEAMRAGPAGSGAVMGPIANAPV